MDFPAKVSVLINEGHDNSFVIFPCLTIGPEHVVIYGTQEGHVFLKNDSIGTFRLPLTSSVFTFSHADGEAQLFWTNSSGNFYGGILSVTDSIPLVRVKEVAQTRKLNLNLKISGVIKKVGIESPAPCRIIYSQTN